ncbi:MAG TPA: Gfo/Idh/MocA family oxidoreductase [Terriglobales bacterium]|jgi:predicted dehydrogenase|nr:Gfo/Idh/MocA family oxidoreductase [Terriglobales bacterium]
MLKVAIVGCGKIADSHAAQIQRIPECEIVGVCDREPLMARQLYERFPIKGYFTEVGELLTNAKPDVVHITTPPASHFEVAKMCLDMGSHVYVEKPLSLYQDETRRLIALANEHNLKITVGHDEQFSHVARRMRALVQSGYLGSGPVHIECHHCYELGENPYAGALLGDKRHWVRKLPGKLLQNVISHGIAKIAEFLGTESPRVMAYGFISPFLKNMGETEIIDELRVVIEEEERITAYFTFSSQMRPAIHQLRVYGTKNGLILDQDHETLTALRGERFKSYAEKFIPPMIFARQYLSNLTTNIGTFLAGDFHMKSGMKYLIEAFYRSVVDGTPPPIPYSEILRTAKIMEAIFDQLGQSPAGILCTEAAASGDRSH